MPRHRLTTTKNVSKNSQASATSSTASNNPENVTGNRADVANDPTAEKSIHSENAGNHHLTKPLTLQFMYFYLNIILDRVA